MTKDEDDYDYYGDSDGGRTRTRTRTTVVTAMTGGERRAAAGDNDEGGYWGRGVCGCGGIL